MHVHDDWRSTAPYEIVSRCRIRTPRSWGYNRTKGHAQRREQHRSIGNHSVRAFCHSFRSRCWECEFQTPEPIPYRIVRVPFLCVFSGAIFVFNMLGTTLMPMPDAGKEKYLPSSINFEANLVKSRYHFDAPARTCGAW